ncbi:ADP/ATP carrier protein [Venturia nashicola]|uniref:ADP/ATP carrier protein n=1 Tax=Venturia nashicola TaxID=86259 RepID=A0A4Z1P593_9PEZI|nr:ADP/ATP carrier protein [Venturia nashicola]TLD36641.1 ADP/ATP carrier protein [Venturia nashicola]
MATSTLCVLFFCFSLPSISSANPSPSSLSASDSDPLARNAFHIFNAVHSSMRQWGSSLNYNGMSFFPARVPKGTEFYHGRGTNETVTGIEWLAFEPEHAQIFGSHGPGERPPGGGGRGPPGDGNGPPPKDGRDPPGFVPKGNGFGSPKDGFGPPKYGKPPLHAGYQRPLDFEKREGESDTQLTGYIHTYITSRDLQFLYIDGMSAGKTANGTLDSQYHGILNSTKIHQGRWDYGLAKDMCSIAANEWKGRVDGFIRMEAGFEVILCDFAKSVELGRITRAGSACSVFRGCEDAGPEAAHSVKFAYLRAVSDRYHGVGGNRVQINYDKFVSAYTQDIDLFKSGQRGPRLQDAPPEILSAIRSELDALVLSEPNPFTAKSRDWQSIVDMIITHYSSRLQYLSSENIIANKAAFLHELDLLLSPFISYDSRSPTAEIARCTTHFLPFSNTPTLASQTTSHVSNHICKTLVYLSSHPQNRVEVMKQLIADLNWTTWKQCKGCGWDEVCLVPIWPFGTEEDWVKPSCVNASTLPTKQGFWGPREGPGGGPGEGPPGAAPPPLPMAVLKNWWRGEV